MNIADITGKPWPEFLRDRGFALFDALFATLVAALLIYALRKLSRASLFVRYSLRAKLLGSFALTAALTGAALAFGVSPMILLVVSFATFALLAFWLLRDLSNVGIINAFETTRLGICAEESLRQVNRNVLFLGIGARKLTSSPEFAPMLQRCKLANGRLRFLLSSPDNPALEEMAKRNGRNDLTYRSRVKESIRELYTSAQNVGVDFEIGLYNLKHHISLPHFRLMFVDDRICIYSQLVWTEGEGLDNPQLVLRANQKQADYSFYKGYLDYFEDLWNLDSTVILTQATIDSWPA